MKLKRFFAAALVFTMTATLFSGCSEKESAIPTLKWYVCCQQQEDEQMVEDAVNQLIEPKIGAKVDLIFIPQNSYQQKMNMIISASEEFDLCFTASWGLNYWDAAKKGAFLELSDLLNEYGKGITDTIPSQFIDMAKLDGKIYAIPNYQVMVNDIAILTYTSLAEKYNFDMSTVKELKDIEPYLEIIKQNEPDKIPYRMDQGSNYTINPKYETLLSQVAYLDKSGDDYKLVYPEEELKELYKMYAKWYDKGYIRKDVATYSDDTAEAQNGRYAVWGAGVAKPGFEVENEAIYGELPVFAKLGKPYVNRDASCATMTAISRTSKHPELAMKLLNLVNTDKEVYNMLCYGIEGTHYEKVEGDIIKIKDDNTGYKPNRDWMFGNQFNAYILEGKDPDVWKKTVEYNESAQVSRISGFNIDKTPVFTEINALSKVSSEYQTLLRGVCGSANFEKQWADYQAALDAAGRDKVMNEIQTQLDNWVKANK